MLYKILPKTKPMYVMSLKNLSNWKSRVAFTEKDVSSNDDTSDLVTASDLDEDDSDEFVASAVLKDEEGGSSIVSTIKDEIDDDEEDKHIEEITSEMRASWKCIKSDSVSWEDDQVLADRTDSKTCNIWKDVEGNWVDDEGVITRPNKSLKIIVVESNKEITDTEEI